MNRESKKSESSSVYESDTLTPTPGSSLKKNATFNDLESHGIESSAPRDFCSSSPENTLGGAYSISSRDGGRGGTASSFVAAMTAPCSPDTLEFQENELSGLPVIPFAFPTAVVAEKLRNKTMKNREFNRERLKNPSGIFSKHSLISHWFKLYASSSLPRWL